MTKLFISYRRKSWPFAHRLVEDLRERLDAEIFIDFTGIDDSDFEQAILYHLRESDVVLLVISEETFETRIHRDEDWVRREIRTALENQIPLVLVCVDGRLPPAGLPDDIKDVARMQGINFYPEYFAPAVDKLAEFVTRITPAQLRQPNTLLVAQPGMTHAQPAAVGEKPDTSNRNLAEALDLLENGDPSKAKILFEQLKAAGTRSKLIDLDDLIDKAERQILLQERHHRAQLDYAEITTLAAREMAQDQVRKTFERWQETYPDLWKSLDTAHLSQQLFAVQPAVRSARVLTKTQFKLPLLEWINIPAGQVKLEPGYQGSTYLNEPLATYDVEPFAIAKYPVTNAQYQVFIADNGYQNDRWWQGLTMQIVEPQVPGWTDPHNPRELVSWYEAVAFSRWLAHKTGLPVTLPTEIQWQWAAVGNTGWTYSFGMKFDQSLANTAESGQRKTVPVNYYDSKLNGRTVFGVMGMTGNVWQWCLNGYDNLNDFESDTLRTVRGGSWALARHLARAALRFWGDPDQGSNYLGFRVAVSTLL